MSFVTGRCVSSVLKHMKHEAALTESNSLWAQSKTDECEFEVRRRLTQDFGLCFEGDALWGQPDDRRRGGFNNCGPNRGDMKWTDLRRKCDIVNSRYSCLHYSRTQYHKRRFSMLYHPSPELRRTNVTTGGGRGEFTRHARTAGGGGGGSLLGSRRRLWRPVLIERDNRV